MYIYPDNLKSKAVLWLWQLQDIGIIGIGCLISVFALAQLGLLLPIVATALYGFLTIRFEDTSILDFIKYACGFLSPSSKCMNGGTRKNEQKRKKIAKQKLSTRQLIGTKDITDYSLQTYGHGELVYFIIKPSNISVQSEASISARIYALMTVLKGMAEIEMCCLNSRENFEDNKQFLRERIEQEGSPTVRKLLEADLGFLDRIQVQMATAREFLIIIRLKDEKQKEIFPYLNRIEKTLREQGFSVKRSGSEDIKRILAVYFEQNVTTERFEDFDGQRWVILGD